MGIAIAGQESQHVSARWVGEKGITESMCMVIESSSPAPVTRSVSPSRSWDTAPAVLWTQEDARFGPCMVKGLADRQPHEDADGYEDITRAKYRRAWRAQVGLDSRLEASRQ